MRFQGFSLRCLPILALLVLGMPQRILAGGPSDLLQVSLAFLTNLAIHESGHFIVAESVGAHGNTIGFFTKNEGSFFLGISQVESINARSRLPYMLGGEIASSLSFEMALQRYRAVPTPYNRSLLFFNGTEFLWYSVYAFYLKESSDSRHDPVAISQETGLSQDSILILAAVQSVLNAYRVFSGQDRLVPYFTVDRYSAAFWLGIHF